jgi:hypothetical protein
VDRELERGLDLEVDVLPRGGISRESVVEWWEAILSERTLQFQLQ